MSDHANILGRVAQLMVDGGGDAEAEMMLLLRPYAPTPEVAEKLDKGSGRQRRQAHGDNMREAEDAKAPVPAMDAGFRDDEAAAKTVRNAEMRRVETAEANRRAGDAAEAEANRREPQNRVPPNTDQPSELGRVPSHNAAHVGEDIEEDDLEEEIMNEPDAPQRVDDAGNPVPADAPQGNEDAELEAMRARAEKLGVLDRRMGLDRLTEEVEAAEAKAKR
jgi:hypothetical protein